MIRRVVAVGFATSILAIGTLPSSAATVLDSRLVRTKVASIPFPTGMQFTPSGDRLFVNLRRGEIRIIERGKLVAAPFATVRTTSKGEGGLLGLALHPDFENGQPWVYAFFTRSDGAVDRVERFRASGNRAVSRGIIFDNMPASFYHHGGILAFGRDGKLYVSNGEAHDRDKAQNPRVLGGKIYRLNPDGSIPSDNPFSGSPTFSYGHRNPFGLAFDPRTGNLWETENGPSSHDEVNLLRRGGNYGWPDALGKVHSSRYIDPILDFPSIIVPTMMAFGGDALPADMRGNLFFGTYQQGSIHRVVLTSARRSASSDRIVVRESGVVGMTMGPDGLYYSTPSGLFRLSARAPAATGTPTRSSPSAAPTSPEARPSTVATGGGSSAPVFALIALLAAGIAATLALLVYRARRPD